ncbi:hypothetical protein quinque_013397 [Culex quinquefasciatus]
MLKSKRALVLSVISLLGSLVSLAGSEYRTSSNGSSSNADSSHYEYNDSAFVNHSSNVIEQISPKSLKNLRHIKPSSPSFALNAKTAGNQYAIDDDLNSTQATYSSVVPSPMVAALRRHSAIGTHSEPPHVKFAILLPEKPRNRRDVRILSTIRPVIEMATRVVTGPEGVLRNVRIEIDYRDTQCSSTYGALGAFDIFLKRKPDVFFGPICDYVIAPIARYNSVWGIPILTTGGLTDAFSIKPNYPTLTRMMGSYSDTGLAVREIRRHFNWTVQAFIYHDNDENKGKGHSDCSMAISSIFRALNTTDYFSHNFDETETSYKDYLQFLTKTKRKARMDPGGSRGPTSAVVTAYPELVDNPRRPLEAGRGTDKELRLYSPERDRRRSTRSTKQTRPSPASTPKHVPNPSDRRSRPDILYPADPGGSRGPTSAVVAAYPELVDNPRRRKPEEGRTRSYGSIPLSAIGEGQQEVRSKHAQAQQAHPNTCRIRVIVDLDRTSLTLQILGVVEAPPVRSSQHTRNWWTTLGAPWKPEEGRTRSYGSIPLSAIGEDRTSFTQQILGVVEAPPVRSSQHTRNWWTTLGAPLRPEEGRTRSYGSIPLSAIGEGQQEVRSKHAQAQQAHPNTCRIRVIVDLDRTSFTQQILEVVEAPPVRSSQHTRNWWITLGAPWKPEEGRTRSYGSIPLSAIGEGQQEVRSKHAQAQQAHPNTCRIRVIVDLDRTSFTQQTLRQVEAPPVRSSQHTRNWWTTLGAPWRPEEGRTRSYGSIPLSEI